MRNKIIIMFTLFTIIIFSACTQQNNPESDFKTSPIDGGKSVAIIEYVGSKWDVRIPPRIQGLPVTEIGYRAFANKKLISVNIPNGVTIIGEAAFYYNKQLTSINIPDSVTNIGVEAFGDCDSLEIINVADGNNFFSSENGVLYNKDKTFLHTYPKGKAEAFFTIPNNVTIIGDYAFEECTFLNNIIMSNSVTKIGVGAFTGCSNLKNINISNSIINIDDYTFNECTNLIDIIIPNSVTSIGYKAFYKTGLTSIIIPINVINIGEEAFINCKELTIITFEGVYNYRIIYAFSNDPSIFNLNSVNISGTFIKEYDYWMKQL